jgi:hypothetical protein
LMCP